LLAIHKHYGNFLISFNIRILEYNITLPKVKMISLWIWHYHFFTGLEISTQRFSNFPIPISLQPDGGNLRYLKFSLFEPREFMKDGDKDFFWHEKST